MLKYKVKAIFNHNFLFHNINIRFHKYFQVKTVFTGHKLPYCNIVNQYVILVKTQVGEVHGIFCIGCLNRYRMNKWKEIKIAFYILYFGYVSYF